VRERLRSRRRLAVGLERVGDAADVLGDEDRAHDREPERGAEVAHRLRDAGDLAVARSRRAVDGVGADRAEHHAHAGAGEDQEVPLAAQAHVRQRLPPQEEADRGDDAADHDRGLGAALVEDPAAYLGGDREAEEEVEEEDAGRAGVLAERRLRVDAGEEEQRHEDRRYQEQHEVVGGEGALLEDPHLDQRPLDAQLVEHEDDQQHQPDDDAGPCAHVVPAPGAGLLQAEHDQAHRDRDQHRPAVVDLRRVARVGDPRAQRQDHGDDRDRHVDPEDRAPGPLRQVAAGERADGGQPAGGGEEQRERLAALAHRVGGDDDRQRGREQQRRARPLQDAEEDHPRLADVAGRRRAAERRAGREGDDADEHHPPVAEHVGELAAEREQRREREQVAVEDPLRAGRGHAEVVLQVRHGEDDDRLVDEHHRDREDHRDQDSSPVRHRGPPPPYRLGAAYALRRRTCQQSHSYDDSPPQTAPQPLSARSTPSAGTRPRMRTPPPRPSPSRWRTVYSSCVSSIQAAR